MRAKWTRKRVSRSLRSEGLGAHFLEALRAEGVTTAKDSRLPIWSGAILLRADTAFGSQSLQEKKNKQADVYFAKLQQSYAS